MGLSSAPSPTLASPPLPRPLLYTTKGRRTLVAGPYLALHEPTYPDGLFSHGNRPSCLVRCPAACLREDGTTDNADLPGLTSTVSFTPTEWLKATGVHFPTVPGVRGLTWASLAGYGQRLQCNPWSFPASRGALLQQCGWVGSPSSATRITFHLKAYRLAGRIPLCRAA